MTDKVEAEKKHWSVDRKVPIALICTILLQSFAAIWWSATVNNRVLVLERDFERERAVNSRQEAAIRVIENGAARLDEKLDGILNAVERMDSRLERIIRQN